MNPNGVASRGELTGAMGATIQTVRKHEMQIEAILEGIKQLMDGQAALGEAFEALKQDTRCEYGTDKCAVKCMIEAEQGG